MDYKEYLNKIYAGFLGMNAGIRLGAPVEPTEWTAESIKDVYGELDGYVKDYDVFSADDDSNGPVFFIRSLIDDAAHREMEAQDVAKAWLNYAREGIGMFWWGGDGISTEHTAYLNLKRGMEAPKSGAAETNGLIMAEQIGGQIFIDTFGWLFPEDPTRAADYAEKAASVSHDKNGLYGARFIAASISAAFNAKSMKETIERGLKEIPSDSTYANVVNAVVDFYNENPDDWRACRQYLEDEWGYDKYKGVVHIIPNAGVCVMALLYGQEKLAKTIEIATAAGWDTDCNAGNVGSIVGTLIGIDKIPNHYRNPINDMIVTSSVSGYLNILDIPSFVKMVAILGYKVTGNRLPEELSNSYKEKEVYYDFILPGATHGFRTDIPYKTILKPNDEKGYKTKGSLEIFIDRMVEGEWSNVFYPTFYRRDQFNDEKYKPTFSPKAYSGQKTSAMLYLEQAQGTDVIVTPYVKDTYTKEQIKLTPTILENNKWQEVQFTIPNLNGSLVEEVGFIIESPSPRNNRTFGRIYLDEFHIYGPSTYSIDFSKQTTEFLSVTPFSHHRGFWELNDGFMTGETEDQDSATFTGHYYTKDGIIRTLLKPIEGLKHAVIFRALGTERYYQAGFIAEDKVALQLRDFGLNTLVEVDYDWKLGEHYIFEIEVRDTNISVYINGEKVLTHSDGKQTHGMFGFALGENSKCEYRHIEIEG